MTNPLRRRRTAVATSVIPVRLGDLEELYIPVAEMMR